MDAIEPYYPAAPSTHRAEIRRLVGFDIPSVKKRGWAWLVRNGFLRKDELGNLEGVPEAEWPSVVREKGKALKTVLDALTSTDFMYGPERLAGRRWHGALVSAIAALEDFVPYADARWREDSDFAAHSANGGYDDVVELTARTKAAAEQLIARMRAAQKQIRIYDEDPLPGLEGGRRPHLKYLGRLEATLSIAGFSYADIAALVWDINRIDDERSRKRSALTSHIERIRKRAAKFRPAILLARRKEALVNERMDQFLRRTGHGSIREAADGWFRSPEAKSIDGELRKLDASARRGK